jgi:hypothetical protein
MLSMIVVGPKQFAKAKSPKLAAVPLALLAKQTRSMEVNMPVPQKITVGIMISLYPRVSKERCLTRGNPVANDIQEDSDDGYEEKT